MKIKNPEVFDNQRFLLVFDLDGTLLNSDKDIEPKTKALLLELKKLGNMITIASGRPPRAVVPYLDKLGLSLPCICYNGAEILNPKDPSFAPIRTYYRKEEILEFLKRAKESSFTNIMAEDDKDLYYLAPNKFFDFFFHPQGMNLKIGSLEKNLNEDILTCVIQSPDTSRNEELSNILTSINPTLWIRFWYDCPTFGEFSHFDINKSTGIALLAKRLGFDHQHILSFGDATNDIEMIAKAGIGFAMKNGSDKLKEVASYTTRRTNDDEGIYQALVDFFRLDIED